MKSSLFSKSNTYLTCAALALVVTAASCATKSDDSGTAKLEKTAAVAPGEDRFKAIDKLGVEHADAATAVPELQKMLGDKDPQVRWRAARSLGDFGEAAKAAVPDLQKQLAGDDPVAAYHAAVALGKTEDKSDASIDALLSAVGSDDKRVARAAIGALRHLQPGPERLAGAVAKALESGDTALVTNGIEAMVERGKDATPMLIALLKRPTTAYIAVAAIEQIGPDAKDTVPGLIKLLGESKHSQVQIQTLLALGRIGPDAKAAVPQILATMEATQDATVPVAAAFALGSIGSTDADPALRAALTKDNAFLQMVSSWALAKIHPTDAALKQQALDKLTAGAKSENEMIRSAADKGLKSLQPPADAAPAN